MDKITDDTKLKTEVPKYQDTVGIRATLNNMGISNNKIGYDENSKTVTLDGKSFMKPKFMDEDAGVSYAPESEIRQNLVSFYKDSSNPIVRVSDAYASAAGKYGLDSNALSYGNGAVMIGGVPLDTLYIDGEGKAWAWRNDVNDLTEHYASTVGASSPTSILERYNREYLADIEDAIYELYNREDFSYSPDDDPVYQAYRSKYMLEGDRAGKNAMANYSALTGGYANSSAVTAGALANQYYAQQLTDKIPELAQQAYERYSDKYQTDMNLINQMISAYNSAYDNALEANVLTRQWANESAKSNVDRDQASYEKYWTELQNRQAYDTQEKENYWLESQNMQDQLENSYKFQGYELDNRERQIYLEYYRRLLDAELEESYANTYAKYYK